MSKFTRTYKLTQHSPLIHFNQGDVNPTLRGTELKPKLDYYLEQNEFIYEDENGADIIDKVKRKPFIIPGQNKALAYKVSITANKVDIEHIPKDFKCFFGNMGDIEPKVFSMAEGLAITFTSQMPELLDIIDKHLNHFFWYTNFGNRQSKGFGSFMLQNFERIEDSDFYHFPVHTKNPKQLFNDIDFFYRSIRSGINEIRSRGTIFYCKPIIWQYAKEKLNMQWDKKTIKSTFFKQEMEKQLEQIEGHVEDDIDNYPIGYESPSAKLLVKDLLGLSTTENWRSYKTTIQKSNEVVDRFKAPLHFKPILLDKGYQVYFTMRILQAQENEFFNKTFDVKVGSKSLKLTTPQEDFDHFEFLDFLVEQDISDYVDPDFYRTREFQRLDTIYSHLNKQA